MTVQQNHINFVQINKKTIAVVFVDAAESFHFEINLLNSRCDTA